MSPSTKLDLPSPPVWGRDGEGGSASTDAPGVPTPLPALPHKGGGAPHHAAVSARLQAHAKRLRRDLTPAERRLWHSLKAHRFHGLQFHRQVPFGRYIADFACHSAKLIIEIDGGQHGTDAIAAADVARDAWFATQGYRVLRFWNGQVLHEHDSVLDTVHAAIEQRL